VPGNMAAQPGSPAVSTSTEQEGVHSSISHVSCAEQETASTVLASTQNTSDHSLAEVTALPLLYSATGTFKSAPACPQDGLNKSGSAAQPFNADALQNDTPPAGSEALNLDRTVATIWDLDTDGLTGVSPDLANPEERTTAREGPSPTGEPVFDSSSEAAQGPKTHASSCGAEDRYLPDATAPDSSDSGAESDYSRSDGELETEQRDTSIVRDPDSESAGFDTEQEEALLAALGLEDVFDASIEEDTFNDSQEGDRGDDLEIPA
jgi:hypothetical protein